MTERERLLEEFDDAYFALLMEGVANKEGEQLIALNEMLQDNPEAEVPESVDKRCLETIDRHFAKEQRRIGLRKAGKVLRLAGTRGLHPVGVLTRPHGRNQEQKSKNRKTNPDGRPRRKEFVGVSPQRRSLGLEPGPDVLRGHVHHSRPSTQRPPRAGAGRLHVLGRRAGARGLLRLRCSLLRL